MAESKVKTQGGTWSQFPHWTGDGGSAQQTPRRKVSRKHLSVVRINYGGSRQYAFTLRLGCDLGRRYKFLVLLKRVKGPTLKSAMVYYPSVHGWTSRVYHGETVDLANLALEFRD